MSDKTCTTLSLIMNRHWDGELPGAAVPVCAAVTGTVPVPPRRHGPGARRTVTVEFKLLVVNFKLGFLAPRASSWGRRRGRLEGAPAGWGRGGPGAAARGVAPLPP